MKPKKSKTATTLGLKNKVPVIAYLEIKQAEALKKLSAETGQPQQFFIREGVRWALDRYTRGVFSVFIEQRRRKQEK